MSIRSPLFSRVGSRNHARIAIGILAVTLLAACATDKPGPTDPALQPTASGNRVSASEGLASPTWQRVAASLVAHAGFNPLTAARAYPILGVAQYLAVQKAEAAIATNASAGNAANGIGAGGRAQLEADRGAVAGASSVVLAYLFPTSTALLADTVSVQANAGPGQPHPAFTTGFAIGRAVGATIVARAVADKYDAPNLAEPLVGPGYWQTSAMPEQPVAGGNLPGVTRWLLTSAHQFRPGPPPDFGSADFNTALAEIRHISDTRTDSQAEIAGRWALNAGTPTASGFWLGVASQNIEQRGLSEREATHIYALTSATMFDATIACWDAKLTYWLIRPWRADDGIKVLTSVGKPNHPSYPSGHSCVSSSAGEVLSTFFPDKRSEFEAMVTEAGLSRMYGGIHYRFDIDAGQHLGRSVAVFNIAADASGNSILTAH